MEYLSGEVNIENFPVVEPLDETDAESDHIPLWDHDCDLFFKDRLHQYRSFCSGIIDPFPFPMSKHKEDGFYTKERYLLLRLLEKILLQNENVKIFGGFVRDLIIHHAGAREFYSTGEVNPSPGAYTDPSVSPQTFKDRNTYPKDIDCFVASYDKIEKIISEIAMAIPAKIVEDKKMHNYTNHPNFTYHFGCRRIIVEYVFNNSLQKKGTKIEVGIDFVYHLKAQEIGPWMYLIDAACNMIYMDKYGLHCDLCKTDDHIENMNNLQSIIDLIQKRHTFIPPANYFFRLPPQEREIYNIKSTRRCTELQAVDAFRKSRSAYRILYRVKYLQRIAKLVGEGWKITNLDIKFATKIDQVNSESICAISHEDLNDNELMVSLGHTNVISNQWTQTSVMKWKTIVNYLFTSGYRVEDVYGNSPFWCIPCPISRNDVSTVETRPFLSVLKESVALCARDKVCL